MVDTLSAVIEFRDCESGEHVKRIRTATKILMQALGRGGSDVPFPGGHN